MSAQSDLRQRTAAKTGDPALANGGKRATGSKANQKSASDAGSSLGFVDGLRILTALGIISTIASYLVTRGDSLIWGFKQPWWTKPNQIQAAFKPQLRLTNEQMAAYDGSDPSKPILLAINRTIYDVSASPHVYGPSGMYNTLAGKDASRSYITTCFDPVDDLVPYLGGVEEVYVPLWLSKRLDQDELDKIMPGEVMEGMTMKALIDNVQKKIGRKKTRLMREEAYERALDRVRAQISTWEGMFAKKEYPIVGKVIGVDEKDENKWKHLGFCEAALKQRPPLAESLQEAVEHMNKDGKLDLGKFKRQDGKPGIREQWAREQGGDEGKKASARVDDMMQGGEYGGGSKKEKKQMKKEVKEEQAMDGE